MNRIIKILPILVVLLCVGWFVYSKQEATKKDLAAGIVQDHLACGDVEKEYTTIGAATPGESDRIRHFCRLHICGMSFMHGRTLAFPLKETTSLAAPNANQERILPGEFVASENDDRKTYDYACSILAADAGKGGTVPVRNVSVVPRP